MPALLQNAGGEDMKKKSVSKLKAEAWKLLSLIMRKKAGRCEACLSTDCLQVHHLIPRARGNSVYFLRDNLIVLCRGCHYSLHNHWSPDEIKDLIDSVIGSARWEEVEKLKHIYTKYSISDYEQMITDLKEELKSLGDTDDNCVY